MKFYLLGTGNVARFVADRAVTAGWECTGVWGRNKAAAQKLAALLKAPVVENILELSNPADIVLLALSDGAIAEVAPLLPLQKETTVVHFSGTLPLGALLPHPNRAVCWPVYSIAGEISPEVAIPFAGEAATTLAEKMLSQLAVGLGGTLTLMEAAQRAQLHLSAVLANNFTNHLLVLAGTLAAEAGLSFEMLQPLIVQTCARAAGGQTQLLQTGPAVRGDVQTEAAHLQILAPHPEWARLYEGLSASIKTFYK
jgi:predicted short-subunit dehydrogenase-like oxidoreductase (DUF2520 family)